MWVSINYDQISLPHYLLISSHGIAMTQRLYQTRVLHFSYPVHTHTQTFDLLIACKQLTNLIQSVQMFLIIMRSHLSVKVFISSRFNVDVNKLNPKRQLHLTFDLFVLSFSRAFHCFFCLSFLRSIAFRWAHSFIEFIPHESLAGFTVPPNPSKELNKRSLAFGALYLQAKGVIEPLKFRSFVEK